MKAAAYRTKLGGGSFVLGLVCWGLILGWLEGWTPRAGAAPARVIFAPVEQGRELLGREDEFVRALSPFDRASRLKAGREADQEEFLDFVKRQVMDWTEKEKEAVTAAFGALEPRLKALRISTPLDLVFIKTTGQEEGGAAYTRGEAIILPRGKLGGDARGLRRLVAHELFHVLSRRDAALRDRLYAAIGFQPCPEAILPEALLPRKLTNPDAPRVQHAIRVKWRDQLVWAAPVLYASEPRYDPERGGEFFKYLQFRFLILGGGDVPGKGEGEGVLAELEEVSGFFEQVGRNTNYVIHPDEILAENFVLLLLEGERAVSPEIVERMKKIIAKASSGEGE